jgi:hypothetical protein
MPLLPPPTTAATVDNAAIGAIGSIPPWPPSRMTAIAAVDDPRCHIHTGNNNDHHSLLTGAMAVIIDGSGSLWQPWQLWSLLTVVVVNRGSGGMEGQ